MPQEGGRRKGRGEEQRNGRQENRAKVAGRKSAKKVWLRRMIFRQLPENRASTQVVGIRCRGVTEKDIHGFGIDADLTGSERIGRSHVLVN
jgi:hypothetical protein